MELEFAGMDFGCALNALGNAQLPAKECILPLLSKVLGYCIILASTIVKVPQIHVIMKNKSIQGLSIPSFELEVVGFTIALAYCLFKGLAFSAYGELVFLLIQTIVLVALLYQYSPNRGLNVWAKSALYCAIAPMLLAGKLDANMFEALYACQHLIFFCSRLPQIFENYKNKSTGQLSFLTNFMSFAGCFVRLFTSIQESAPTSMIVGSILGVLTNGVVMIQFLLYNQMKLRRD
ncbi:hypothetical protein SELMODRAFT_272277 [Selaginella moellendorffii]|uniref:Mannose-P-dolichol utilization defect 1 protein homolog n=1 Tax=Selaginella moellendorffii TaxID=88036 RepID=D8TAB1_SELML|nr:mannose-P-dolichol utilization defect 1 protein homolog 2 [Selaginella moellendorffii]EFJ06473.1 hypothetical protein SELMODRAFT_272277 [Selaginella moellendorffii]|eukprot:XP_002992535.1 mannose-P-dolichol utilization defect 1 protein homolog 2 [Selaginella moellendorffii]